MYTIKDFLNGKVAALISNQRQWNSFIDLCEKHGVTFRDNVIAKEWPHDWEHKHEVILCRTCWDGSKILTWQYEDDGLSRDERMVHVKELLYPAVEDAVQMPLEVSQKGYPISGPMVNCRCACLKEKPPKHPRYKIVIECNDDFTTARMFVDGYPVKGEVAKRNPADKFNWRIGAQTAFDRLWEKKKKPVKPVDKYVQLFEEKLTEFAKEETEKIFRRFDKLPPCCAEVKRLAKPGEWVKIVKKSSEENEDYKIGDVLQIVHSTNGLTGHAYYKDMRTKFLYEYEYVVLEGYKPE